MEIKSLLNGALVALFATGASSALAQTPAAAHASSQSAIQAPSGSSAPGYSLTHSEQTFVLTRGSTIYNKWKGWIEQENAQSARRYSMRNDGTTSALYGAGGIGRITITVQTPHSSDMPQSDVTRTPPDNGPPVGLPATGTPGQHLTLVNETTTVYQRWTYEWQPTPGGRGPEDWTQISYQANSCAAPVTDPSPCKLMPK